MRRPRRTRHFVIAAAIGLSMVIPAMPAQAAVTWVVDDGTSDNDSPCAPSQFRTISAAVAIASPGDTIQVCEGTYRETVSISTPGLTLVGPHQVGLLVKHDAQVISATGGFVVGANADDTRISGFLIRKAGSDGTDTAAIESTAGATGVTVSSNGFRDSAVGVRMTNPSLFSSASVSGNDFKQNTGTDIIIPGVAHNLRISNEHTNNYGLAVDFQGDPTELSVGVAISGKVKNERFLEIANTDNAQVTGGRPRPYSQGDLSGSAITDRGNNVGLYMNQLRINSPNGTAITLSADAGMPSVGTEIRAGRISGRNGIVVTDENSSVWVTRASIYATNIGIYVDSGRGNQFTYNTVNSDFIACQDLTVGPDGGPLNDWRGNTSSYGASSPAYLCP